MSSSTTSSTKKRSRAPLVATPDVKNMAREDIFSKVPSMTDWTRQALEGASQYELEKLEPLSEPEIKRIFPHATATVMRDPLTTQDKTRIHDNIRRDPYTGVALFTYCYFMLGPDSTITLGLNRKYANEQRKADAMAAIQDNAEYLDIIEDIMNRDDAMDLQERKLELVFQGAAFGRSVAIKKYDKQNLPCQLIPLSSTRLGRIWIDSVNWKFLGVEYNDYARDKRILLAKDIIHYENNDMMITPRSRYYGMSMLEPIMAIGERNRVANEIAMPEIMRKHWAPILLVKVNSGSQTKINQIRDIFSMPGKTQIYNDEIEVTQVALQHDLEKLQVAVENGAKDEFRACTVPQGIGWSYDPNHATMENSLLAWYNGVLAFKRSHLDSVLWLQFYKPQLETIFENRMVAKIPETGGLVDYLVQNAQTLQGNEKPELPFRITTQFNNIKTTGFLEQSSALLGWYDAGIISKEIALKEGGMEQYIDDMAEEDANKVQLGANMLQAEQQLMMGQPAQAEAPTPGPAISGVQPVTRRSIVSGL